MENVSATTLTPLTLDDERQDRGLGRGVGRARARARARVRGRSRERDALLPRRRRRVDLARDDRPRQRRFPRRLIGFS